MTVEPYFWRQQQRHDTAEQWAAHNPILRAGEIGVYGQKFKIGDGATHWNELQESNPSGPSATGVAETDEATLNAAMESQSVTRVDGGVYVVTKDGIAVPADCGLLIGSGSAIKTDAGELNSHTSGTSSIVSVGDGATFVGAVDGNRNNQTKTAFNGAGGSNAANIVGVAVFGEDGSPLSKVHVDATISNVADYPANFSYVNDSYVRIRANDCGGPILFSNCDNLQVDIEITDADNDGWKVFPHAVDFINCSNIRGRVVISGQKGTGTVAGSTSLSDWFSGLTIVDSHDMNFTEIDCEAADLTGQSKGLGISLLGVRNLNASRTRSVGYSDCLLEVGGVVDSTLSSLDLDGRYADSPDASTANYGMNIYNNAQRGDFKGRTLELTKNVKFLGGSIRRCLGLGVNLQAAVDTTWVGVKVAGCKTGAVAKFADQDVGNGPYPTTSGKVLSGHLFYGCEFSYNERSGFDIHDLISSRFYGCRAMNNSQSAAYGGTRLGLGVDSSTGGIVTRTSTNKTDLLFDVQVDDSQGFTAPGFPDPARAKVIAVDRPEKYAVGQTLTITGAGSAGADLLTRVDSVDHDELTLQHSISTFPTVTLTGTVAITGTTVTGSGTAFTTELVGRAFVKVGSEYRRVAKVTSNTAAVLDSAFTSNVTAGSALTIVRANITAANSQLYGLVLTADTISPIVMPGFNPSGNVSGDLANVTASATPLLYLANNAISSASTLQLAAAASGAGVIQVGGPDANHAVQIKSKGASSISLRGGDGNSVLSAIPLTGSANYLTVNAAMTGGNPSIQPSGNDTNVGLNILPKGTGRLTVYVATGQTPTISASGADTNHNLNLVPKGSGVVQANGNPVGVKVSVPASATATGVLGQWAADSSYVYICTATDTWKRAAIAAW